MASFPMAPRCLALVANARECRSRRARAPGARSARAARAPLRVRASGESSTSGSPGGGTLAPLNLDASVPFYQIRALIRPWRLTGVMEALESYGIRGLTTYDAQGAGVQAGSVERYQGATFDETTHNLVAKTVLEVVLEREQTQDVVNIIINAAQTGEIGDGKIFLTPVHDVVRIRTGETGADAERMAGGRSSMFAKKKDE
jgi:nitrogen regulatory protein PII